MLRTAYALALLFLLVGVPAEAMTLRFASLAPTHSRWGRLLAEMAERVRSETEARVDIRLYLDGKLGDERTVVKKLGRGVDGAFFTGQGMGIVHPPFRVMELPFLIRTVEEADAARAAIWSDLEEGVKAEGRYRLLAPGETGMIHLFGKAPIDDLEALRSARIWVWEGDQVAARTFEVFGVSPRPLDILSVPQQLKTGALDTVYNSAAGAAALGWTGDLSTVSARPFAYASGGMIITQRAFDRLSAEDRRTLAALAHAYGLRIIDEIREENAEAMRRLTGEGGGLRKVPIPDARFDSFAELARESWPDLAEALDAEALLPEVRQAVDR